MQRNSQIYIRKKRNYYKQRIFKKNYSDHNYAKKAAIIKNIEKNKLDEVDMNKEEFHSIYFKYIHLNYPSLLYNDILLLISEKYHPSTIYYSLKKLNNFKNNKQKLKNLQA